MKGQSDIDEMLFNLVPRFFPFSQETQEPGNEAAYCSLTEGGFFVILISLFFSILIKCSGKFYVIIYIKSESCSLQYFRMQDWKTENQSYKFKENKIFMLT